MRSILAQSIRGERLVGTVHHPCGESLNGTRGRVGLLILNFGQAPRAGLGDLAARMGDGLASQGYPVFRFDLPGLGDSAGELPERIQVFWRHVQEGGHAEQACELAASLIERFKLKRLVLGGLCGGAITAIYAAAKNPDVIAGVLAIEPDFILTPLAKEQGPQEMSTSDYLCSVAANKRNLLSLASWGRFFSGQSAYRHHFELLRRSAALYWERMRGRTLPEDANVKLVHCTRKLAERKVPMLIVSSGDAGRAFMENDVLGSTRAAVRFDTIDGTNHLFIAGRGPQELTSRVETWMFDQYPSAPPSVLLTRQQVA